MPIRHSTNQLDGEWYRSMTLLSVGPYGILILPPRGSSRLPYVEIPRHKVEKKGASIKLRKGSKAAASANCSYGDFQGTLDFNAWRFFHAAKKTELAGSFAVADGVYAALLAGAEFRRFFEWLPPNFRIRDQGVFSRIDATRTYLAGRSGVAINSLLMNEWDYVFWDHIPTLYERALRHANISHAESARRATIITSKYRSAAPAKEPDFAFEKATGEVALMESKGKFVNPGDANPPAKGDLKEGLEQLDQWPQLITPTPQKTFVIGTYLRETSDNTEQSLILYVDPPPRREPEIEAVRFPRDWIRRGNYGNWLVGMGLELAGFALREGREKPVEEVTLPIITIGGRPFAFTIEGIGVSSRARLLDGHEFFHWPEFMPTNSRFVVTGIDVAVLRLIERSLRNAADLSLLEIEPLPVIELPEAFYGSTLPDGSLWAALRWEEFRPFHHERFKL
jgi:hypothetical protein